MDEKRSEKFQVGVLGPLLNEREASESAWQEFLDYRSLPEGLQRDLVVSHVIAHVCTLFFISFSFTVLCALSKIIHR
jgi:hypothetical protein